MREDFGAWWKLHGLKVIVFVTGGAILVIEIAATRILSPYYGNSVYTVSSVISVILGALSFGYARGGIEADKTPHTFSFYTIIYRSGVAVLTMTILALFVLPIGSDFFSLRFGPLIWSVILFFPPSYLLGKLSPFAIKLAQEATPHKGLGALSGSMFFWSTAGSIIGSLLTGFFLIPTFGTTSIFYGVTIVILTIGITGQTVYSSGKRKKEFLKKTQN